MTIDLNKEAEEYAELQFEYMIIDEASKFDCINDFIAGANSKYVQAKILQAQIDILKYIAGDDDNHTAKRRQLNKDRLEQQLKELKNE